MRKIIEILISFFSFKDGNKTKTGLYVYAIGFIANQFGLDIGGDAQSLANNFIEFSGLVITGCGLLHDTFKKIFKKNDDYNYKR